MAVELAVITSAAEGKCKSLDVWLYFTLYKYRVKYGISRKWKILKPRNHLNVAIQGKVTLPWALKRHPLSSPLNSCQWAPLSYTTPDYCCSLSSRYPHNHIVCHEAIKSLPNHSISLNRHYFPWQIRDFEVNGENNDQFCFDFTSACSRFMLN